MYNILLSRKAATNVVATMLIFGIMIASVGVLYSQIAPTLLGYETSTTTTNQTFIFNSISDEVLNLASSTPGSVGRVHIIADQTIYDIDTNHTMNIQVLNNGIPEQGAAIADIAELQAKINGSFQPTGLAYENRVINENNFLNNNSAETSYVLKSSYNYREGSFSMYFRSRVDVHRISTTSPAEWKITITILQIDFVKNTSDQPVLFPIELSEWTLRLRRQASNVTILSPFTSSGNVSITHSLGGVAGTTYSFPGISSGDLVHVEMNTIPILFSI